VVNRVPGGYRDFARRYRVLVDDVEAGVIGRGKSFRCEVPAGTHKVQLKIDWCTSPALPAVVNAGGETAFGCAPGGGARDARRAVGADRAHAYINLWSVAGQGDSVGPGAGPTN
jgi:hypothetical protein